MDDDKAKNSKLARDAKKNHNRQSGEEDKYLDAMDLHQEFQKKKKTKITGKDKAVETAETEKDPCGICLAEEGVNPRGKMDSCEHYFCFACIAEWAKLETRCPTCRQRFTTICRPCQSLKGNRGRTIRVPLRNQVHIPPDNGNEADQDPYEDVFCTECNNGDDDDLLLLCDLCDAAAHTYCVGLGRTMPTGEWYCRECEASSTEYFDEQEDEDDDFVLEFCNGDTSSRSISMAGAASTAQTVEKVNPQPVLPSLVISRHASSTLSLRRGHKRLIQRRVPSLSNAARAFASQSPASATAAQVCGPPPLLTSTAARTLSGRRLLQERIQAMRENWKALQHGELQFSSQPFCFATGTIDRSNKGAQPAPDNHLKENKQRPDYQTDIDRAWAMMERAKSLVGKDLSLDDRRKAERSYLVSSSSWINKKSSEASPCTSSRPVARAAGNSRVGSTSSARHNNSVLNDRNSSVGFTLLPFSEHSTTSSAMLMPQIGDCPKNGNQASTTTICEEEHSVSLSGNLSQRSNKADAMQRRRYCHWSRLT